MYWHLISVLILVRQGGLHCENDESHGWLTDKYESSTMVGSRHVPKRPEEADPLSKLETVGDQLFCLQICCTFPSYHITWNLSFSFTWIKQSRNTVVTLSDFFWYLRSKLRPPSLNSFARELILSENNKILMQWRNAVLLVNKLIDES